MFRNLTIYRFPSTWGALLPTDVAATFSEGLAAFLADFRLRPVGPLEMTSRGFIPPLGRDSEALVHSIGEAAWVALGGEEKILPPSVVAEMLERKLDAIEETEGRRPGGRARQRLKQDLVAELLPRAFVQPTRADAFVDFANSLIIVDTASRKVADAVVSELRSAVGTFPALPLNAETAPRGVLTDWLAGEALPAGLCLGEECELKDPADGGAVVRCQNLELRCEEIDRHLESGKQCTKLALSFNDHVSFIVGEDLVVRKLKFLDGALDTLNFDDVDSRVAELDALFALQIGELRELWPVLEASFRLSRPDAAEPAPPHHERATKVYQPSTDPNQRDMLKKERARD